MARPRILWVGAAKGCESNVPRAMAGDYFNVVEAPSFRVASQFAQLVPCRVACWDLEEVNPLVLRTMRNFKIAHPSVPLLMLTTPHSESLAVWAFRARVWNYLVRPVATSELRANFDALARLVADSPPPPRPVWTVRSLLPDDLESSAEPPQALAVKAALAHVESRYTETLRQSAVAAGCGMSSSKFSRAFKAHYGMTFSDYLMRFRIARACRLLRQGSHGATSAGLAVGFDDPSHFARAFRKLLGMSPSVYQRQKPRMGSVLEERRFSQRREPEPASTHRRRAQRDKAASIAIALPDRITEIQ